MMIMVEDIAEVARIKTSIKKLNNNDIVKDDTTSSISKPILFGGRNLIAAAIAEAVKKR